MYTGRYKSTLKMPIILLTCYFLFSYLSGKKRKDQADANQAAMGLNPAYAGAYGAAPPVSIFSVVFGSLFRIIDKTDLKINFLSYFSLYYVRLDGYLVLD